MTDTLLAFSTDYGLYVVAIVVFLAALGIPLPASILVLTSGGLASTGDVSLTVLFCCALAAYFVGDQLAYQLGKSIGPSLFEKVSKRKRLASVMEKSEEIYRKHGIFAILLSRTVVSPCGPYVAYISGAWSMNRMHYTCAALSGASIWTFVYIMLGYSFAGSVPEISDLMASAMLVALASLFAIGFAYKLAVAWREFKVQLA